MKYATFLLIISSFSCYLSINAAAVSAIETREWHFGTSCFRVNGFLVPAEKYDTGERRRQRDADESVVLVTGIGSYKNKVEDFCKRNAIDEMIAFYKDWKLDLRCSPLLKEVMFPDHILDTSPYSSPTEENNATKLAILLSAISGNIEGKILALEILSSMGTEEDAAQLNECRTSLRRDLETPLAKRQLDGSTHLGLRTLPYFVLSEESISEVMAGVEKEKNQANARTLLRIADRYLRANNPQKTMEYFELAANKGSIRAVTMMASLIANRKESTEKQWAEIQKLLLKYSSRSGGYEDLLPAYYYQYGALGLVKRDLKTANQQYKKAVNKNCREAAFEYGEFLMSMMNGEFAEDAKTQFYNHAIAAYEKAGDLGQDLGYSKALALIARKTPIDTERQSEIQAKLHKSREFFRFLDQLAAPEVTGDAASKVEVLNRMEFISKLLGKIIRGK